MDIDEIKKHWNDSGKELVSSSNVSPTSRDPFLATLERENILEFLPAGAHALEMGCGDGRHTAWYARKLGSIAGIDISEQFISIFTQRMTRESVKNFEGIVGSVLDVDRLAGGRVFDVIISQRCLINLPGWDLQREAILKAADLIRPGGLLLITEGFEEGLAELNETREKLGLHPIKVVDDNKNIPRKRFEDLISGKFETLKIRDYGLYLFLSRVFHPALVSPEQPKHDSRINEAAMRVALAMRDEEAFSGMSYNLFYVLRKKA